MHGLATIEYDQSDLPFPVFKANLEAGDKRTQAPLQRGTDTYVIPEVRMAHELGVRIRLF